MDGKAELIEKVEKAIRESRDPADLIREAVAAIHESSPRYDWTGVYLLEGSELVLRSFLGKPSPHERIPVGKGICGAAVREGATVIVPDVRGDPRYLACSLETRSEMVVPILRDGAVIGEIDIDSDTRDAFGKGDRQAIEEVARLIAPHLEGTGKGKASP